MGQGKKSGLLIATIVQGWPLPNIYNQTIKVKVKVRECFLIQYLLVSC